MAAFYRSICTLVIWASWLNGRHHLQPHLHTSAPKDISCSSYVYTSSTIFYTRAEHLF